MWGHDRGLPLREQDDFECSYKEFWAYRRLVRRWRLSEANAITDPERKRAAVVQARRMLRCSRPDVSPFRGVSAWVPESVAKQLFDSIEGGER